jgi:hypothetical protein
MKRYYKYGYIKPVTSLDKYRVALWIDKTD